jgi:hypothetical protein
MSKFVENEKLKSAANFVSNLGIAVGVTSMIGGLFSTNKRNAWIFILLGITGIFGAILGSQYILEELRDK